MIRNRISLAIAAALLATVALAGCKKKEDAAMTTPPASEPAPAPAPVEPAPAPAPATVVSGDLGNAVGAAVGGGVIGLGLGYPAVAVAGAVMALAGLAIVLASRQHKVAPPFRGDLACGQEA